LPTTPAPALRQTADMNFLASAQKSSQSGEGFSTATFVGQEKSCTLGPPSHIPVYTMEALNSDRPGTASLAVSDDVYDSVTGYCLMIPKGSKITGPYSSDIRVGQERVLVATTQLRLPNGKEAYRAVETLLSHGRCDFDVVIMQINWCSHHQRFSSAWDALSLATNIHVAEDILNENYDKTHSIAEAIAY
jgi:hypothetical protein